MYNNFAQRRERRFERIPDPDRQHFAGRIFQSSDFVEAAMIQLVQDRGECGFHLGKIHDPARIGRWFAANMHFDAKRMPMHARAFVPGRHARQPVCGFELKDLENVHMSGKSLQKYTEVGFRSSAPLS